MELNKLLRADYLDILFDGRNKRYGGYELRRRYGVRTRKAVLGVVAGFAIAAAIPVIASSFSGTEHRVVFSEKPIDLTPPPVLPKEKVEIPVHPDPLPAAPAPTIKNPIPTIAPDEAVSEAPVTVDDMRNKQVAMTTNDGPGTLDPNLVASNAGGNALVEKTGPAEPMNMRTIEQLPQFDGDLDAYLSRNLRYPEEARTVGIEGRVGVEFLVNEDGTITRAVVTHKASPSLDAEALRVVRAMPRWKPGKQGGKAVKCYFVLPVNFTLD